MNILGIDPGTITTGYTIITDEGELVKAGKIHQKSSIDTTERIINIARELNKVVKKTKIDYVAIEKEFITGGFKRSGGKRTGNVKVSFILNQLVGAIYTVIALSNEDFDLKNLYTGININSWKKVVTGNGRAGKEEIKTRALTIFPNLIEFMENSKDYDITDSACIAEYCRLKIEEKKAEDMLV